MEETETNENTQNQNKNKNESTHEKPVITNSRTDTTGSVFLLVCIIGVSLGILLEIVNVNNKNKNLPKQETIKPKYWVYSAHSDVDNRNGLLKHVHLVLERVGYEKSTNYTPWDLLWSHDYPFRVLYPHLHRLKPHQKVNHFPGSGYITTKVDLATSDSKYIPKAFKLPQNKEHFLKYAKENKDSVFLEKHNHHRGVYLKNVSEINLSSGESFVQEYVQKPFLVDGHKFDIGVYVVLTSVNPLRAYWYKGDVLFRYCPTKYYPFDPKDLDKYVVRDDYLPTWEVPSLAHSYTALGYSMKDSFDIYARSKGKDPSKMWEEVQKAISEMFVMKEKHIIEALKNYPSSDNFFELMRFDLMMDEDLRVFLLEANMSPNLSSAHYPPNQLLYEQVMYNVFSLTGVSQVTRPISSDYRRMFPVKEATQCYKCCAANAWLTSLTACNVRFWTLHYKSMFGVKERPYITGECAREKVAAENMVSTQKNIAVWGDECSSMCKDQCVENPICGVCKQCMSTKLRDSLLKAHREYLHRGDFRRLFPQSMKPNAPLEELKNASQMNKLQHMWYQGKCNTDTTWCT